MRLEGHSLGALLKNPKDEEWAGPPVAVMAVRDVDSKPHFSVRSRRYRYTLCGNGEEELYDHSTDAHEWTNLAGHPRHSEARIELRQQLMTILRATKIPAGFPIE